MPLSIKDMRAPLDPTQHRLSTILTSLILKAMARWNTIWILLVVAPFIMCDRNSNTVVESGSITITSEKVIETIGNSKWVKLGKVVQVTFWNAKAESGIETDSKIASIPYNPKTRTAFTLTDIDGGLVRMWIDTNGDINLASYTANKYFHGYCTFIMN